MKSVGNLYQQTTRQDIPPAYNPEASTPQSIPDKIFESARNQDLQSINILLAQTEGSFDHHDAFGNTLSHFLVQGAASSGVNAVFEDLKSFIQTDNLPLLSLQQPNQAGKTPLHLVAENFKEDIWNYLVEQGANPELGDNEHQSARDILEARNPRAAAHLQGRQAARVSEQQDHIGHGQHECGICLSNINIKGYITPCCKNEFHMTCIKTWLDGNTESNKTCPTSRHHIQLGDLQPFFPQDETPAQSNNRQPSAPPFHTQFDLGEEEVKQELPSFDGQLEAIQEVLEVEPSGLTTEEAQAALHGAARDGDISLLERIGRTPDVDFNAPDSDGETPVYMAAHRGRTEAITELARLGANLETPDSRGRTPVHAAALFGKTEAITELARLGARIDTPNRHGFTPVYFAALQGKTETITELARLGANLETPNSDGETPVYMAARRGRTEAITALKTAGVDLKAEISSIKGKHPIRSRTDAGLRQIISRLREVDRSH